MSITREDQLYATALLHILETTEQGQRFLASLEYGRRYRKAQAFYSRYDRRAIDWIFASNLDRGSKAIRAVLRWYPDKGPAPTGTLVLQGDRGCGKTTAAVALLLRHGGEFVRASDIGEIGLGDKGEAELDRLRKARLLVLDNLGSEADMGPTRPRIRSLVIYRDGRRLPTVITTTLLPSHLDDDGLPIPGVREADTIAGRYDMDVVDRVCGDGEWADVDEPSRRRAKHRPDLTRALRAAELAELYDVVIEVKRGGGDRVAVARLAEAARVPWDKIEATAREAQREMVDALAEIPGDMREHPVFARYLERWGVAREQV